jgi:hypothetical protein
MYRVTSMMAGHQPFNDWFLPDTVQRHDAGLQLDGVDIYWGYGVFIYSKAKVTIVKGNLCRLDNVFFADLVPNTANTGAPIYVAMMSMASGQWGWFMKAGQAVLSATASVAADVAIGLTAAGQIGANTAGKQILGARNFLPSTTTVVKAGTNLVNNNPVIVTSGYDGWFVGAALSGTGIAASSIVAILYSDGRSVGVGTAIGTLAAAQVTATGVQSITATYTGYNVAMVESAFVQGAIT